MEQGKSHSLNGGSPLAVPTGTWNAHCNWLKMRDMWGRQLINPAHQPKQVYHQCCGMFKTTNSTCYDHSEKPLLGPPAGMHVKH